jgi:hypothetical protein
MDPLVHYIYAYLLIWCAIFGWESRSYIMDIIAGRSKENRNSYFWSSESRDEKLKTWFIYSIIILCATIAYEQISGSWIFNFQS